MRIDALESQPRCLAAVAIRKATDADARQIARIHVESWREAYQDILPAPTLLKLSLSQKETYWSHFLSQDRDPLAISVLVVESDHRILGFGTCGLQRDEALCALGVMGEINAIYLAPSAIGKGYGTQLFRALLDDLVARGWKRASAWVLANNTRARKFYEMHGGLLSGERVWRRDGIDLKEVAYFWSLRHGE